MTGGDGGIRTLDASLSPHAPLAGECLRPLGHVSGQDAQNTVLRLKGQIVTCIILLQFQLALPIRWVQTVLIAFQENIMDVAALTTAGVASSQQGTQQRLGLQAIKNAADAQNQLAGLLDKSAQDQSNQLRTSGSIGTNINTTA